MMEPVLVNDVIHFASAQQNFKLHIKYIYIYIYIYVGLTRFLAQHTKNVFDYENWIEDYPMMEQFCQ